MNFVLLVLGILLLGGAVFFLMKRKKTVKPTIPPSTPSSTPPSTPPESPFDSTEN